MVSALNSAIGETVNAPEMIDNLARAGNEPAFATPAQFAATVRADIARWAPVVKASGFVAED
jgi:tripartite-type tricarboxylate transporter receptor subunit TctC